MSELCLLAASLLTQGQIPGWKLATPPVSPEPAPTEAAIASPKTCQAAAPKGTISGVEVQQPEFSRPLSSPAPRAIPAPAPPAPAPPVIPAPTAAVPTPSVSTSSMAPAPYAPQAIAPERSPVVTSRVEVPNLDSTGISYLPDSTRLTTPRPFTGSQLYQQRIAALQSGRVYTRLPANSYQSAWVNATTQPTYEQWVSLLSTEARAIARGQGSNRLTVMLGDSLCLWYPQERMSSDRFWLNQGISGDTTAGVLGRISAIAETRPDTIQVMVGINDLRHGATDEQVLTNLRQIMQQVRHDHPQAQIFIQSILPTRFAAIPSDRIRGINERLAAITKQEGVNFVNLQDEFSDANGNLRRDLTTDGLHLSAQGYALWQIALQALSLA